MSTATTPRTVGFCLEPLDVLFFRDGRPFGAATRASSGQPMPQTLTGALRTALLARQGFSFESLAARLRQHRNDGHEEPIEQALKGCGAPDWLLRARVRGPFLARLNRDGTIADILVPAPAVLHQPKDGVDQALLRLSPLGPGRLPGWRQELRPLWLQRPEPTEPASGYLTCAGQEAFLRGHCPAASDVVKPDTLFGWDHRTGIEVLPDQLSAKEGGIYGATFLALRPGYTARPPGTAEECPSAAALYAELLLPDGAPPDCAALEGSTLPLGGEGRRVAVHRTDAWKWPGFRPTTAKQKPLLLLTTPGLFKERWRPAALQDRIVAAAVPGAVAVSGWDLARGGPKPNRFAAAAGSVYFLESLPDGLPDALSDDAEDRAQGWGCYLKGVWTDE